MRLRYFIGVFVVAAVGVAMGYRSHLEASLLRADPDTLVRHPGLFEFAVTHGAAHYREYCSACHGLKGLGDRSRGIPNLADSDWLYGSGLVSDIERVVAYGIRSRHPKSWNLAIMPAFAQERPSAFDARIPPLSPADIRNVVEYLVSLQQQPAERDAAAKGAKIYSDVGGCYDCHSPDGRGDTAIGAPNLVDGVTLYGDGERQALFDSIAEGRQGVCPAWSRTLKPAALREVAVYVFSLSRATRSDSKVALARR